MRSHFWRAVLTATICLAAAGAAVAQTAPASAEARQQLDRVAASEQRANAGQPPAKVMDAVGVKPGMVIGELGAGRGRYTVHLAGRVGASGKVYANDIDAEALAYLRERCVREKLTNVEIILGTVDDPRFPAGRLDMVFMVWVYHMLEHPATILKNIVPALKAGATVVMVEPIPSETEAEIKMVTAHTGKTPTDIHVVTRTNLAADAALAGLEIVQAMEGLLEKDNIYVLRRK
jgi:SAM-dependent methyltransferase